MIKSSLHPHGSYKEDIKSDNRYMIIGSDTDKCINNVSIAYSILYNKYANYINKNTNVFIGGNDIYSTNFAKFVCSIVSKSNKKIITVDMNDYVTNYVGGDVERISAMVELLNKNTNSIKCCLYIPTGHQNHTSKVTSTIDYTYKKLKCKTIIACNTSTSLYINNKRNSIEMKLTKDDLLKYLGHCAEHGCYDKLKMNDMKYINDMSVQEFVSYKNIGSHINARPEFVYSLTNIQKNHYGIQNTLVDIMKTLKSSRYGITLNENSIGVLNCGVEGSGKTYLGEQLSKISGVVTITKFDINTLEIIKKYNNIYPDTHKCVYLMVLDECEKYFNEQSSLSMFKEFTGANDFPDNIMIYASTNKDISEFDQSLYRTGRLQYVYWDYVGSSDVLKYITNKEDMSKWLDIIDGDNNIQIRFVDLMLGGTRWLDSILIKCKDLISTGVTIKNYKESETENRSNTSMYKIMSVYGLNKVSTLKDIEYLIICSYLDVHVKNLSWYVREEIIKNTSINIYKLPFKLFVMT